MFSSDTGFLGSAADAPRMKVEALARRNNMRYLVRRVDKIRTVTAVS